MCVYIYIYIYIHERGAACWLAADRPAGAMRCSPWVGAAVAASQPGCSGHPTRKFGALFHLALTLCKTRGFDRAREARARWTDENCGPGGLQSGGLSTSCYF